MNRTNRALNRIVLFIVGILFLAIGAVLVAIIVWPERLKAEALSVTVGDKSIAGITGMSIAEALHWVRLLGGELTEGTPLSHREQTIAAQILKELKGRLGFCSSLCIHLSGRAEQVLSFRTFRPETPTER